MLLRVDFYDENRSCLESREFGAGDVILLAGSRYGFNVLEEIDMIEFKQGLYAGDADKTKFPNAEAVRTIKKLASIIKGAKLNDSSKLQRPRADCFFCLQASRTY
jgi:hypothetical protein